MNIKYPNCGCSSFLTSKYWHWSSKKILDFMRKKKVHMHNDINITGFKSWIHFVYLFNIEKTSSTNVLKISSLPHICHILIKAILLLHSNFHGFNFLKNWCNGRSPQKSLELLFAALTRFQWLLLPFFLVSGLGFFPFLFHICIMFGLGVGGWWMDGMCGEMQVNYFDNCDG